MRIHLASCLNATSFGRDLTWNLLVRNGAAALSCAYVRPCPRRIAERCCFRIGATRRKPLARRRAHCLSVPGGGARLGSHGPSRHLPAQAVSAAGRCGRGLGAPHRRRGLAPPRARHAHSPACRLCARRGGRHRDRFCHGAFAPGRRYIFAAGEHRRAHPRARLRAVVPAVVRPRQHDGRAARRLRLRLSHRLQHLDRGEGGQGHLGALGAGDGRGQPAAAPSRDPARRAALRPHRNAAGPGPGVAHPGRRGDARRGAVGARLDDFRRARGLEHRPDARRRRRHRRHRACAGEARVPAARAIHRRSLGDDVVSAAGTERATSAYRAGLTLLLAAACYEAVARSGAFPPALLPTLPKVASTLWALILDGTMLEHAGYTMYRVLVGLALAVAVALPLGILMGRFRPVENFFLPLASALMPIPSLAWVPVFILWFGLGNTVAILIVFYAALFPMLLNAWSGVRAVNPLWLRAAGAMGADERALFWKVIIPGAS